MKLFEPEPFGPLIGQVEIASMLAIGTVSAVALAKADRLPAAGLVTCTGETFRIRETLGYERCIAEMLSPLFGQDSKTCAQCLRSKVGTLVAPGPRLTMSITAQRIAVTLMLRADSLTAGSKSFTKCGSIEPPTTPSSITVIKSSMALGSFG
jgi:hypothetical protein